MKKTGIFFLLILVMGCFSKRKVQQEKTNSLTNIFFEELNFENTSFKLIINFKQNNNEISLDAWVKIQKDKLIWMSITSFLGIEVARLQITKDSVEVLNRLENTYQRYPLNFLEKQLGLNLDLLGVQQVLMANFFSLNQIVQDHSFRGFVGNWNIGATPYQVSFKLDDANKKIQYLNISNSTTDLANITYSYQLADGLFFPKEMVLKSPAFALSISINYSRWQFNKEETYPFKIPEKYEKKIN